MVSLDLAVCLGPVGPGLVHGGRGRGACPVPQSRAVTGPVVGDDPLDGNPDRLVPGGGAGPEPRAAVDACSLSRISEYTMRVWSSIAECRYRVPDHPGLGAFTGVAPSPGPPPPTRGDTSEFLHIDMDQLAGAFTLIPLRWQLWVWVARSPWSRRPTPEALRIRLHRRSGQADLEPDMGRTPTALPTQLEHPPALRLRRAVR